MFPIPVATPALDFFRDVVLAHDGDECLDWPFATSKGYARLRHGGKTATVARLVCEEEHGPPPSPNHQAAHSCGRGALGCVAKRHLSWKTPTGNNADKIIHGTRLSGARAKTRATLTEEDIRAIRASAEPGIRLAARFGVTGQHISRIRHRRAWAWLR